MDTRTILKKLIFPWKNVYFAHLERSILRGFFGEAFGPIWPQDGLRCFQDGYKMPQEAKLAPKTNQDGPKTSQDGPRWT